MKKISILIPCYNEEENIAAIYKAVTAIIQKNLSDYEYEIVFAENCSTDTTRDIIRILCKKDKRVKAIFNARNFGQFNSPYYAMCQLDSDCVVSMCCDFQDPVEMIPRFVKEWEAGYKIVSGIKSSSKENKLIYMMRSLYYKIIKNMSSVDMIEHFTGFGLYDKSFIKILKDLDDPVPFIRGIVAEFGYKIKQLEYEQPKRRAGKTHNNFYTLYDAAMLSITSYTKVGLRLATLAGFVCGGISFIIALVYLILKIIYWDMFSAGMTPVLIGIFLFGSIQLFFTGLLGEYVMNINTRVMHRPLVIEEERINFESNGEL